MNLDIFRRTASLTRWLALTAALVGGAVGIVAASLRAGWGWTSLFWPL